MDSQANNEELRTQNSELTATTPVQFVKGVGPARAATFAELGVQTFDETVSARILRPQKSDQVEEAFRFLKGETGAVVHADLIAGLPGEDVAGFSRGFNRLVGLGPDEIQVGILKRLRGVPIARHDDTWGMVYRPEPPYDLVENGLIPKAEMDRLKRFGQLWERVWNHWRFRESAALLWRKDNEPFARFMAFAEWFEKDFGRTHAIPLPAFLEKLFRYLTHEAGIDPQTAARTLAEDYQRDARRSLPRYLKKCLGNH